jgi:hypothetical protein
MIQTILLMAIIGLTVAHLYVLFQTSRQTEEFENPTETYNELENPSPYHPLDPDPRAQELSPVNRERVVATPYRDLKPDSQEDLESDDDPLDLPWIASWTAADRFARQGHNCAVKYIKGGPDGTTIVTTSKSCEAGMPHTRAGNRIIIPDSIPEPLRAEIIAHELVHIYQRRYPDKWEKFYERNWSFILRATPPPSMPKSVVLARRSNPDTFGKPWACWMERYWPVPVYTDPQTPSLREAITIWWDERDSTVLKTPPAAWKTFFGEPSQDEHPNEIAAVMIVSGDTWTEAGRRLLNWWKSDGALIKSSRNSTS